MLSTLSKHLRYTSPLAAILAVAACGGSGETSTGSGGTGGGTTTTTTTTTSSSSSTTSSSGSGGSCDGFGDGTMCPANVTVNPVNGAAVAGGSVTAKIVDEAGAPVANQPVYICGTDLCTNPQMTAMDGSVSISTTIMMKNPAFKFGDATTYAELAIPMAMATANFPKLTTAKLSDKPGAPLTPGTTATSGEVSISIPAGASVSFDIYHAACEDQVFHAVNLPLTDLGPVLDPVTINGSPADFKVFYAMGPAETAICPSAKVTVPNSQDWPAQAAVEFWIMTTDTTQKYAPYGGWAKMSDGAVSADGKTVSTNDGAGQGFVLIENFAIRLKP